jgi:hypothetical protein
MHAAASTQPVGLRADRTERRSAALAVERNFPNIQVTRDLRLADLWRLYEDTGFLYPEKVERIRPSIGEIHRTIGTLLRAQGDLLETVTTRSDGALTGHLCALRAYRHTWIIQHLAARRRLGGAGALNVAIAQYAQARPDIHWLKMYFRPDNAFPRKVFGSYAESVPDPCRSDLREFHYLSAGGDRPAGAPTDVVVRRARPQDYRIVERWFASRGRVAELMANDLVDGECSLPTMSERFDAVGLRRRREVLVAERCGLPTGFALLEVSSLGMNLSELTNAFTVHPIQPDPITHRALNDAATAFYRSLGRREVVALAESPDLEHFSSVGFMRTKSYLCWTVHRLHLPGVLEHFKRIFGRTPRH